MKKKPKNKTKSSKLRNWKFEAKFYVASRENYGHFGGIVKALWLSDAVQTAETRLPVGFELTKIEITCRTSLDD